MTNGAVAMKIVSAFQLKFVKRTRATVGENFLLLFIVYPCWILVEGGSSLEEVIQLAKEIEKQVQPLSIQGLAGMKPVFQRLQLKSTACAFTWVTEKLKGSVSIPLITSNRIKHLKWLNMYFGFRSCRYDFDGSPNVG